MGRGKKYQPEQVVNLLRRIEVAIANGKSTILTLWPRQSEVSEPTRPGDFMHSLSTHSGGVERISTGKRRSRRRSSPEDRS